MRDEAADAARRREPAVGQEAVSSRSRMRRPVRSQWLTPRHGRLKTVCCLSAKGVAKTKQRFDRAVGPAVAPCAQMQPQPQRFFNELKSHPIEGRTLSDHLAEKGKLSESETIKLLKPIAAALDYAHGEKVIHRDVKPSNIIIRNDGHPFILDFGIAREIQESMTRVTGRTISGTLLYMSPEQLRGAPPRPAQDVYSFAAMCYECLSGNPPFTKGEIAYQILNVLPVPLKGNFGNVKTIMQGLSKNPGNRPENCADVLMASRVSNNELLYRGVNLPPLLKIVLPILVFGIIGVCIVGWWMKQSNHLSIQDETVHTLNGNFNVPKRRSSLSNLSWEYYDDAYYSYSIDEREKHRRQGFDKNDPNRWLWLPACAGIDLWYDQPTEKLEQEFRGKVEKEFSEINAAFKSEDVF